MFHEGAVLRIAGEGIVRWTRRLADREYESGFGVEITWLEEASRPIFAGAGPFAERPAFIPIGVRRRPPG